MMKKLVMVTALALLTAACSNTVCQTRGCQAPQPQKTVVREESGVWFAFDSAVLKPEGEKTLLPYAKFMERNPSKTLLVKGYADAKGPEAYNVQLSKRRAEAAKAFFVKQGVDAGRISTKGYGKTNFVADNETEEGRAKNRRIELSFK